MVTLATTVAISSLVALAAHFGLTYTGRTVPVPAAPVRVLADVPYPIG